MPRSADTGGTTADLASKIGVEEDANNHRNVLDSGRREWIMNEPLSPV